MAVRIKHALGINCNTAITFLDPVLPKNILGPPMNAHHNQILWETDILIREWQPHVT